MAADVTPYILDCAKVCNRAMLAFIVMGVAHALFITFSPIFACRGMVCSWRETHGVRCCSYRYRQLAWSGVFYPNPQKNVLVLTLTVRCCRCTLERIAKQIYDAHTAGVTGINPTISGVRR